MRVAAIIFAVIAYALTLTAAPAVVCPKGFQSCTPGAQGAGGCFAPAASTCTQGRMCQFGLQACAPGPLGGGGCFVDVDQLEPLRALTQIVDDYVVGDSESPGLEIGALGKTCPPALNLDHRLLAQIFGYRNVTHLTGEIAQ